LNSIWKNSRKLPKLLQSLKGSMKKRREKGAKGNLKILGLLCNDVEKC